MPIRNPRRAGVLLKTGQITQYSSELDDGYYEIGLDKRYAVLTTGQYSGTSNIDLIHFTDTDVSFHDFDPDMIVSAGTDLSTLFNAADTIVVTGDSDNNGTYTIASVSSGSITLDAGDALSDEAAGDSVSIAKREALSNNCVQDLVTGRMWARYTSAENGAMGTASDGKMPWTDQLYDIFQWCAAANTANLGGYSDWRIPNASELSSLRNLEAGSVVPDATAFPSWPTSLYVWTSSTRPDSTTSAMGVGFSAGYLLGVAKTGIYWCALVRGSI